MSKALGDAVKLFDEIEKEIACRSSPMGVNPRYFVIGEFSRRIYESMQELMLELQAGEGKGRQVRTLRVAAGFTLNDLEDKTGIAVLELSAYENSRKQPTPGAMMLIERACGQIN
jgi:hypothetical protein